MQVSQAALVLLAIQFAYLPPAGACEADGDGAQPVYQSPSAGAVGDGFGPRLDPTLGVRRMHLGVDYFAPLGDPVVAVQAGAVVEAGRNGAYGLRVVIRHQGGVASAYAHLNSIRVAQGDCVAKGDVIGTVGSTGLADPGRPPHLHFEALVNERFINPTSLLVERPR
jgi:murein DD-endopeptidase MepM/ murein hydrolase activator NlpD